MTHRFTTKTRHPAVAFPLLGTLALALTSCAISQQQEVQMGAQYSQAVAQQLPLVQDPEVVRYSNVLGDPPAKLTAGADLDGNFTVVDSKEVNAFALPGGYIYINRGLIERAKSLDEVAGVLGHEIGHVVKRHSVKQMQQQQGAGIGVNLACVLTRICDGALAPTLIDVTASAVFAKFSRSDEQEADAEGVRYLIAARIDPTGIPEMFRILLDERKENPDAVSSMFATHPLEEDRIASTTAMIKAYPAAQTTGLTHDSPNFQAFKRRLMSLPPSPTTKKK